MSPLVFSDFIVFLAGFLDVISSHRFGDQDLIIFRFSQSNSSHWPCRKGFNPCVIAWDFLVWWLNHHCSWLKPHFLQVSIVKPLFVTIFTTMFHNFSIVKPRFTRHPTSWDTKQISNETADDSREDAGSSSADVFQDVLKKLVKAGGGTRWCFFYLISIC